MEESEAKPQEKTSAGILVEATRLASGMLYVDRQQLLIYFLLAALPAVLAVAFAWDIYSVGLVISLLERVVHVLILYNIGNTWIARFEQQNSKNREPSAFLLIIYGVVLGSLFELPALLLLLYPNQQTASIALILWIPAVIIVLTFYFYFFPILLGHKSFLEIKELAVSFIKEDRMLPLKAMFAPFAIMLLMINLAAIFSPDERLQVVTYFRVFANSLFFLLSAYLSLAICFVSLSQTSWRNYSLDPYRQDRFETLHVQGPKWLARLLEIKNGVKILIVAILLGFANFASLATMAPPADIRVKTLETRDHQIILTLAASDQEYKFRGFSPLLFSLAGPEGQQVTEPRQPTKILINGQEYEAPGLNFPKNSDEVDIKLTFKTDRKKEHIDGLKDLYLWYRSARLQLLDLSEQ